MARTNKYDIKPKMTMAENVRQQLAAEIAAGILVPGTRLDEIEQSARLGVSRTPLREALRQLAALGLVRSVPHRGMTVAEGVSPYMVDALAELEALCACRAASRLSGPERSNLRRMAAERGDWLALVHAQAGNPVLVKFTETLWQPLLGALHRAHFADDAIYPLAQRFVDAVAEGHAADAEAAARAYVEGCAGVVLAAH